MLLYSAAIRDVGFCFFYRLSRSRGSIISSKTFRLTSSSGFRSLINPLISSVDSLIPLVYAAQTHSLKFWKSKSISCFLSSSFLRPKSTSMGVSLTAFLSLFRVSFLQKALMNLLSSL